METLKRQSVRLSVSHHKEEVSSPCPSEGSHYVLGGTEHRSSKLYSQSKNKRHQPLPCVCIYVYFKKQSEDPSQVPLAHEAENKMRVYRAHSSNLIIKCLKNPAAH